MTELTVRVTPRASSEVIEIKNGRVHCRVTAPPEKGKANAAVVRLLSKTLDVPKSAFSLTQGAKWRDKTFAIDRLSDEELADRLGRL